MMQHTQSVLPPATKGLLDFLREAKMQTPSGQPTIAGQLASKAGIAAPEAPQPPPQAPEQQGIASILDQAKQAGPTIANNQQQAQAQQVAQQAAQMMQQQQPQQAPQQPPQGMAEGGLATLPVSVGEFKEGGVIGFEGTTGSYVNPASPAGMLEQPPEVATSEFGQMFEGVDIPENQRRNIAINKLRRGSSRMSPGFFESLTPSERASRLAQASQMEGMINSLRLGSNPAAIPADHAMAEEAIGLPSVIGKDGAPAAAVPAKVKAEAVPPGIAAIKLAAKNKATISAPAAQANAGITPPTVGTVDTSEAEAQYARLKALQEGKPDMMSLGLADLNASQQRDKKSEGFRRYAAVYGAREPGINAGSSMVKAAGNFEAAQNKVADETDKAKTALVKAKHAEAVGDVEALLKYQEEFNKHKENIMQAKAAMDSSTYTQQMTSARAEDVANIRASTAQQLAEMRMSVMLAQQNGKNLKNPADVANMISDNVQKLMQDWDKSRPGMMATEAVRRAQDNYYRQEQRELMRQYGATLPEVGAASKTPAVKTVKLNP